MKQRTIRIDEDAYEIARIIAENDDRPVSRVIARSVRYMSGTLACEPSSPSEALRWHQARISELLAGMEHAARSTDTV